MWHKKLEKKLLTIFEMPKVLWGEPWLGKEQDVLFCTVREVRNKIKPGLEVAEINGTISIIGQLDKNLSGFLSKRIQLSKQLIIKSANKRNPLANMVFYREEQPITMVNFQERFNVYSMRFTYFYEAEYNPTDLLEQLKLWLNGKLIKILNLVTPVPPPPADITIKNRMIFDGSSVYFDSGFKITSETGVLHVAESYEDFSGPNTYRVPYGVSESVNGFANNFAFKNTKFGQTVIDYVGNSREVPIPLSAIYKKTSYFFDRGLLYVDDTRIDVIGGVPKNGNTNICIGSIFGEGGVVYNAFFIGYLYLIKHFEKGVEKGVYLPAEDKDGNPCLYEELSKTVLYPKGAGTVRVE